MFTKIRMAVTAALLTASMFAAAGVHSVSAASPTDNLAGRPISGDTATACQATAYGKVGGYLVLFTAWHCRHADWHDGDLVYGPAGGSIGYWGSRHEGNSHDLDYIVLWGGSHPTSGLNTIYRGNPGYTPYYWTITGSPYSLGCYNINVTGGVQWGDTVLENYQTTGTSTTSFRTGQVWGWEPSHIGVLADDHYPYYKCTVAASQTVPPYTSGSSFILAGHATVFGIASASWNDNGTTRTVMTPMAEGLLALNYQTATQLCYTSDCTPYSN